MRRLKSFLFQNRYTYTFETGDRFFCVSLATLLAPGVTIDRRSERQPRLQHERERREERIRQKCSTHPFNWDTFGIFWEGMGSFGMDPNLRQGQPRWQDQEGAQPTTREGKILFCVVASVVRTNCTRDCVRGICHQKFWGFCQNVPHRTSEYYSRRSRAPHFSVNKEIST